eukprot:1150296-Pelagomonas_calceolata.AAC.1
MHYIRDSGQMHLAANAGADDEEDDDNNVIQVRSGAGTAPWGVQARKQCRQLHIGSRIVSTNLLLHQQ